MLWIIEAELEEGFISEAYTNRADADKRYIDLFFNYDEPIMFYEIGTKGGNNNG